MRPKLCLELESRDCKYPVAHDPDAIGFYYFCAEATADSETAYCLEHRKLCNPERNPNGKFTFGQTRNPR